MNGPLAGDAGSRMDRARRGGAEHSGTIVFAVSSATPGSKT